MSTASIVAPPIVVPSESQRAAIEAAPGPLLVLAGPGAGKTFCLTERIRFLIERHHVDPARICAFTFTNKAAGEISHRLDSRLGVAASRIKGGTIHAFCADLLRELGAHVLLEPGFGIADEDYQLGALRRLEGPRRWHRNTLTRFSAHRFRGDALMHDDLALFERYERFLHDRKLVDFDTLVIKAAELLERPDDAAAVRSRWDVVLVDEFQDLNPVQYRVIRALASDHRHIFAVGDDEQSIYSWAGADPAVFTSFLNDFGLSNKVHLEENRRCPHDVFALARRLVTINTPIFADRVAPRADRASEFPVRVAGFETDDDEAAWLVDDIRADQTARGHRWGDVALLYRKHDIGNRLEAAFLSAGIPCRLAQGRALADDPVVAYVIAAVRVIANPSDDLLAEAFFKTLLPRALYDEALAKAEENGVTLRQQLQRMARSLPRGDEVARQIRRAFFDRKNLEALGKQHTTLAGLVQELLSKRVGQVRSVLHEHQDEITDPTALPEVVTLAERLQEARRLRDEVWIAPMGGAEIAIKGILTSIGIDAVRGGAPDPDAVRIVAGDVPSIGLALGAFKAAQLIEMRDSMATFADFTAIDLETTDNDIATAEIVEIAAVRVRGGQIVDTFVSLVKPRVPISPRAGEVHGITAADVENAPFFEEMWPQFRDFVGDDVAVAHNGYEFDFPVLQRMAKAIGERFKFCPYDALPLARDLVPTSRKLVDLARHFGVSAGTSHRALDDTRALAGVLLALFDLKRSLGRKTALVNLLDHLGVALALSDEDQLGTEARLFRDKMTRALALGRYSDCLEWYGEEAAGDESVPSVDQVINKLGGLQLMLKIRAEKSADERYPQAMTRLRQVIDDIPEGPLDAQVSVFLERVVLSSKDGPDPNRGSVNLLTLHSTKGLEFSRVYVVGAEDAELPGGSPSKGANKREVEEARRLLYVGMTRTIDRLVLTQVSARQGKPTGGHQFLDEMGLTPEAQP